MLAHSAIVIAEWLWLHSYYVIGWLCTSQRIAGVAATSPALFPSSPDSFFKFLVSSTMPLSLCWIVILWISEHLGLVAHLWLLGTSLSLVAHCFSLHACCSALLAQWLAHCHAIWPTASGQLAHFSGPGSQKLLAGFCANHLA